MDEHNEHDSEMEEFLAASPDMQVTAIQLILNNISNVQLTLTVLQNIDHEESRNMEVVLKDEMEISLMDLAAHVEGLSDMVDCIIEDISDTYSIVPELDISHDIWIEYEPSN